MLTREFIMRQPKLSSFKRLVEYCMDDQGNELRVKDVNISNCASTDVSDAINEILLTQSRNTRSKKDKTMHLVLSFNSQDESKLTPELRKKLEKEFIEKIGFGEHQRISIYHGDTDNPHIHIALNKINPKKHTINDPEKLWPKMRKVAQEMEKKYGISVLNAEKQKTVAENRIQDAEAMSGQETLCSYIRKIETLKSANTWQEFQEILKQNNIKIQVRANGFIFTDGTYQVKASTVHRDFSKSKLEKKYGPYSAAQTAETEQENNTTTQSYRREAPRENLQTKSPEQQQLYEEFKKYRQQSFQKKKQQMYDELRKEMNKLCEKRQKEIQAVSQARLPYSDKKKMYQAIQRKIEHDREIIYLDEQFRLRKLREKSTWRGYLHEQAKSGNHVAVEILQQQNERKITAEKLSELESRLNKIAPPIYVTKNGSKIYKTSKNYIRISRSGIWIQDNNASQINWKQGFTRSNINDVVLNTAELQELAVSIRQSGKQSKIGKLIAAIRNRGQSILTNVKDRFMKVIHSNKQTHSGENNGTRKHSR